jgi:hypothetical protein
VESHSRTQKFFLEPATAYAEIATTIADVVDGHRSFGQQTRIAKQRAEDQTAHSDTRGERG